MKKHAHFFNYNVNFSFRIPKTDVCNFCFENKKLQIESEEFKEHKLLFNSYTEYKKEILSKQDSLIVEFDFAQNLPVPKLPINEQYYSRLLWLNVFNVHVYNSKRTINKNDKDNSYVLFMLEGLAKKGANTVLNFVYNVIMKEFDPRIHKKIVLLSDGCGGQNKNYLFMQFFLSLSKKLSVSIEHVFPVVGHSFNQCDRNFGMCSKIVKKTEIIESVEEYVEIIKNRRTPQFIIVTDSNYKIIDFESCFPDLSLWQQKEIRISKQKRIIYYPDNKVDTHFDYKNDSSEHKILAVDFNKIKKNISAYRGVPKDKIKDVTSLTRYLKPKNKKLILQHFKKVGEKLKENKNQK